MTARTARVRPAKLKTGPGPRLLLTGFGPFGEIQDNPSGRVVGRVRDALAERLPGVTLEARVLPVEAGIIEPHLDRAYSALICFGVDATSRCIRVETEARNFFWDRFREAEGKPIDPTQPQTARLRSGALPEELPSELEGFALTFGGAESAGTYVCNDTLFRTARRHPRGYFVHLPLVPPEHDTRLVAALTAIAEKLWVAAIGPRNP